MPKTSPRHAGFVISIFCGSFVWVSIALGQCTATSHEATADAVWTEDEWDQLGQTTGCDQDTVSPLSDTPRAECNDCTTTGDGCGTGGPVEFSISDQCGASCSAPCANVCAMPCDAGCCAPSCVPFGCACGCSCDCVGFGDFCRCCDCWCCKRQSLCQRSCPNLFGSLFGPRDEGGCCGCGCGCGDPCPPGIDGLRVRGAGPGAFQSGGGCLGGRGCGGFGGGGCGAMDGGCGLCGDGCNGLDSCGDGDGHGWLGWLHRRKDSGRCGCGCPQPPQGPAYHCGMPAPQYPCPFYTPRPTAMTYHTYGALAPHNSLPQYRGTYSYKHGPGLSRTTVHWRPTKVCNAIDMLHHKIELPR